MINPAELEKRPIRESPPIFTDEQVKDSVRGQIQYIVGQVQFPIRAFMVDARSYTYLFAMQGREQYSSLKNIWGDVVGRTEVSRSQELAFGVMKEFGFDPNALIGESQPVINGKIIQKTATYPSKTIGGLVFDRITESVIGDEAPSRIEWGSVIDSIIYTAPNRIIYTAAVGDEKPFRVEWRARDAARRFRIGNRDKVVA